ncbi:MAG TPA: amidase [Candidatus Binatia bacterium]|jgi:aspartyl-tRNA(Asn)/glutamyl-tRNA(Gln) amidotransferase subunit A|nr:amidase [Candidatus Binatia bacterium]
MIRARQLSPVELVRAYLQRIEKLNPSVNAYLTVTAEEALAAAAAAEQAVIRGEAVGSLLGIPVALKDNCDVAGVRMTAGTKFLRDNIAVADSEVAARLRRAGAIFLGKLNMHEWAIGATTRNPFFGPCRNPWDPQRIPGGSSGGSGAALAADMTLAAIGTDTGGSVRIPAALNGISGIRPTVGRVSNRGVVPVSWTFDTVGPMARRAEDVAHLLQVVAGYDPEDPTSIDVPVPDYLSAIRQGVKGLYIGMLGGHFRTEPELAVTKAVQQAAQVYAELGAHVEEVELPGAETAIERTSELILTEAAAFHQTRREERPEDFGQDVMTRLNRGAAVTGVQYALAREAQRRWQRQVEQLLVRYDLLLAPTCGIPAPLIEESEGVETTRRLTRFTYPLNLALPPVLSIPCGFTAGGLPIGLQVAARHWQEALVLRAAWAYQQATDWHLRRPRV